MSSTLPRNSMIRTKLRGCRYLSIAWKVKRPFNKVRDLNRYWQSSVIVSKQTSLSLTNKGKSSWHIDQITSRYPQSTKQLNVWNSCRCPFGFPNQAYVTPRSLSTAWNSHMEKG